MQTAPRIVRTAARQVVRAPGLTATSSSSSSPLYSLHSHHTAATAAAAGPLSSRFPTSHVRALSSTARAEAKEPEQDPFASEKFASDHAPLFQRIQEHPEVLDAIENMARITREKTGVDLSAGQKPSMMMMLQLARDPDLRAASERLMAALRAAGVEFNPAEAFQALQQMGGAGFEKMADKGLEAYHEKVRKGEEDGEGGEGKNKK